MTGSAPERPTVSVVMACHNAREWVARAIASVLQQTFDDFELILVDDGSTDDTWSIIKSQKQRDTRIIGLSKVNTGLADSLNFGMSHARGAWIARLDADDLSSPTRLAQQFGFVRADPTVVLVGTAFFAIDEHDSVIGTHGYPAAHRKLLWNLENLQRFFPHSSAMFNREVALADGGYNTRYQKAQDWDLWFRLAEKGKIACIDDHLVRIRRHSAQITNSASGPSQLVYAATAATCHFLRMSGLPDPSCGTTDLAWHEFVMWVSQRMTQSGLVDQRSARAEARDELFSTTNRVLGALKSVRTLVRSGQLLAVLKEAIVGLSLPKELADEWSATGEQGPRREPTDSTLLGMKPTKQYP